MSGPYSSKTGDAPEPGGDGTPRLSCKGKEQGAEKENHKKGLRGHGHIPSSSIGLCCPSVPAPLRPVCPASLVLPVPAVLGSFR